MKESFGGLKKFLEKYPEIFLISQDHPFNPHVYLKESFTIEEQKLISVGSTEFLTSAKRKKTRRGKGRGNTDSSDVVPSRDLATLRKHVNSAQNSGGSGGGLKVSATSFVPRQLSHN